MEFDLAWDYGSGNEGPGGSTYYYFGYITLPDNFADKIVLNSTKECTCDLPCDEQFEATWDQHRNVLVMYSYDVPPYHE